MMMMKKIVRFTAWVNINVYFYLSISTATAKHEFMVFWFFHFDRLDLSVRWQHIIPIQTKYKLQQQCTKKMKSPRFMCSQRQQQKNEIVCFHVSSGNKYFMLCYYDDVNKDAWALIHSYAHTIHTNKNRNKVDEIVCRQQEKVSNDRNKCMGSERDRERTKKVYYKW